MLIPLTLTRKRIGYYPLRFAVAAIIRIHRFFADKDTNNFLTASNTLSQNLCH